MTSQWGAPQQQWGSRSGAQPGWGAPPPQAPPGWGAPQGQGQQGPFAPQAPFGQPPPQGYGQFTPPRRKSPLRSVFLALSALALLAIVGAVVLSTTSAGSDQAFQNDNYQVPPPDENPPPLPYAQSESEVAQYLQDNPIYDQTVPNPVRCPLESINVTTASDTELEDHLNELTGCLMRVWEPPVTGAGYELPRPSVTVYGSKATTKCGTSGVNAFYCGADQQVYFSNQLAKAVPAVQESKWGVDIVVAHEFGHALQARTGTLITAKLAVQDASESDQLVSSRRLETQADCYSGMFINSVSISLGIDQSEVPAIEATYTAIGDDTLSGKPNIQGDHGLARSRLYWGQEGLGNTAVSACNTFDAPPAAVR